MNDKISEVIRLCETSGIQGKLAQDSEGNSVMPDNPDACGFCVLGAIAKVFEIKTKTNDSDDLYNMLGKNELVIDVANRIDPVTKVSPDEVVFASFDDDPQYVINILKEINDE